MMVFGDIDRECFLGKFLLPHIALCDDFSWHFLEFQPFSRLVRLGLPPFPGKKTQPSGGWELYKRLNLC